MRLFTALLFLCLALAACKKKPQAGASAAQDAAQAAEVRAYHHGDRKNPRGDLLGFDHAARGYTTMEDWRAPSPS